MAVKTLLATPASHQVKLVRVFRCTFYCEECTRSGSEWTDVLLTAGPSWCPACERQCDPDFVEEFEEEAIGWEDDDEAL
jgi:hypothetical protein